MNRRHTADDYRRVVERLRALPGDIALSSDFIVGFPGETDRDFAETLRLVTEVGYAQAYSFKYSPRPGTPAAHADDQVPEAVKAERLDRAAATAQRAADGLQPGQRRQDHGGAASSDMAAAAGQLVGRSPFMQAVHVAAPAGLLWLYRRRAGRGGPREQPGGPPG